ncbi:DHA2 family efflux MFS transporter permease subunit [Mesorhizobium mediterraneum]|uniref:DHA2 family efflux MFS transporter permease subunit n=1 Tax=Mesorhizobium mediterraneum TaxID=43617 RepID=UPI00177B24A7|nr:DHA2 family efflux MFS transporter permease subunit [Mesorhizobium mediterraneum]
MPAAPSPLAQGASDATVRRVVVAVCAMMGTLMQALDTTIANVALPYMQGSLSATSDQITWVLTSYIVAAAIMTAPVGWLSARFGRRTIFVAGLVGFTLASMLCGIAQSLEEMVIFRITQGLFGAALVPLSQSIMLDLYPPEQRGQAMAIWGVGVMVGPILGPTLGGYLTEIYNWRWVFYVNLPFGVLATAGLILFFRESVERNARQFDWLGFAVLGLGVGALQMMLDRGELMDWFGSTEIVTYAVLSALGFYLFAVHTATARTPLLAPRLFKDINFLAGCLLGFVIFMILLAATALLAPYLQTLGNYPVETAGLLMAPRGIGTMIAMIAAGRLIARTDPRLLMAAGLLMIAGSLWMMTGWTPDVSRFEMVTNAIVQGAGVGFVFTPLTVVAFATLPPELRTDGTAFFNLIRNIGGAIGISVTSFLLTQNAQIVHAQLATHVNPFNRVLQSGAAFEFWNIANPATLASLNAEITRQASIVGYVDNFKLMMLVCVAATPLLLLVRRGREPNSR